MSKTDEIPRCLRCGHPKDEHRALAAHEAPESAVLICPTALFLLDTIGPRLSRKDDA